ncbi:kinase-like protein [Acephala macrosclerotiorum]|nr:kinase-like protein [Acephala macrosclerotiorum]
MRLSSIFEGVTITQEGILMCKCREEMVERVKKTASEPVTDDDKFWRCPRVKPHRDQCQSIIWFNEFDNVKPQLGPAPESAEPHTPRKKGTQELIDGYLTPSTHGKLNKSLKENESSERLDGRFKSKQALSNSKRPATTTLPEQTSPTKRKTEVTSYYCKSRAFDSCSRAETTSTAFDYDESGYHINSVLDRGAFGIVTKVHHRNSPKITYARKQLPLTQVSVEKVQEEVELMRQAAHRHVVEVVDEYQDKEWYYIVMKPLADRNLQSFLGKCMGIQPNNPTSWNQFGVMRRNLFHWIGCLAVTMKYLHDNNIRHRDIKPQNILVHGSSILLTDFGISFTSSESTILTYTSTQGTERYQPPEANGNIRYGRRGDIFALGCVFFEMAEAASKPVLMVPFPRVTSTYASCVSVAEFRDRLSSSVKEHPRSYRSWLKCSTQTPINAVMQGRLFCK